MKVNDIATSTSDYNYILVSMLINEIVVMMVNEITVG